MTPHIPEELSTWLIDWRLFVIMANTMPPRDPDEDEDEEEEEDEDEDETCRPRPRSLHCRSRRARRGSLRGRRQRNRSRGRPPPCRHRDWPAPGRRCRENASRDFSSGRCPR